jgi:hypothetical protein
VSARSPCLRCLQPLAVESDSGLCPVCLASDDTLRPPMARGGSAAAGRSLPDTIPASTPGGQRRSKWPDAPPGYELVRALGGGGMGEVYLARDLSADRLVAMKFLRHPGNPTAVERFLTEVRALAAIDHPNIVRVFGHDFYRAVPFFTMEFVGGGSLGERVKVGGPLDPTEAARVVAQAARAVSAAHAARVLHRDLKPSNILLAEDGAPKVSDFGLAKRTDKDDGITTLTGPLGTPSYMPPEQVSGRHGEVGEAADVYGLGATLYTLLTRRAPFAGDTHAEIVAQVEAVPPKRIRALRPEVPLGLEAIALKCLEKKPADRYPTAAALADDLERFLAGGTPDAPQQTRWRRVRRAVRPRLAVAALTGLVLAAAFALGAVVRYERPVDAPVPADPVEEARKELASGRPVTLIGPTGQPRYSRWVLETCALGESPLGDKTCAFHMFGYGMLELFPAPGIPHYRIDLELRHLQSQASAAAGDRVDVDFLGVYVGYSSAAAADNSPTHAMFGVSYRDSDREAFLNGWPPRRQPVSLSRSGFHQRPNAMPNLFTNHVAALEFMPPRLRPGDWRPISIECAPDRLLVRWRDDTGKLVPLADWPEEKVRAEYRAVRKGLGKLAPGAEKALPEWNPDTPFGLFGYKASLAVRNVVITPLP